MTQYNVFVTPKALREIRSLPGNLRHRVKRLITQLALTPHPPRSKALNLHDVDFEVRRLRIGAWRIVYAITEHDLTVDILAIRKRPPYDYGDLNDLLE